MRHFTRLLEEELIHGVNVEYYGEAFAQVLSPEDLQYFPEAATFIWWNGQLFTGGAHVWHIQIAAKSRPLHTLLKRAFPDIRDFLSGDDNKEKYVAVREYLESQALLGRIANVTRSTVQQAMDYLGEPEEVLIGRWASFWNRDDIGLYDDLDKLIEALHNHGLVDDTLKLALPVSLKNFGIDKEEPQRHEEDDETEELNKYYADLKRLHIAQGQEKRDLLKKLGLGSGGGEHPMQKALKDANLIGPGQKWWAMHSESRR